MTPAVLELADVVKDYRGLRPLRLERFAVAAGESVAIVGLDRATAEVFVNLVTGAALPDRGEVKVFGRATSAIEDSAGWLTFVDRFGIVSERAVLLDGLDVLQNLSMPFTLDIEPPPEDIRLRAASLAREAGLGESTWPRKVGELDALQQSRVRLARALALDPAVLLLEHASAGLSPDEAGRFGRDVRAVAGARGVSVVVATADRQFAEAVSTRVLMLEPASGRLAGVRRGWFRRRLG